LAKTIGGNRKNEASELQKNEVKEKGGNWKKRKEKTPAKAKA